METKQGSVKITNSHNSLQIGGNGTVSVDAKDVKNTEGFKTAMKLTKDIVDNNNKNRNEFAVTNIVGLLALSNIHLTVDQIQMIGNIISGNANIQQLMKEIIDKHRVGAYSSPFLLSVIYHITH